MRHLTVGDKSILTGDEVSDLLIQYTALLVQQQTADTVDLAAFEMSGTPTTLTLLLSSGLAMVAETIPTDFPAPDNGKLECFLRGRIDALIREQNPPAEDIAGAAIWNHSDQQPD